MKYVLRVFLLLGLSMPALAQITIDSRELSVFLARNRLDIQAAARALTAGNPQPNLDYRFVLTRTGGIGLIRIDAVLGDFVFANWNAGRFNPGPVHNFGEPFHARRSDFNFQDVAYISDMFRIDDEGFDIYELEFHAMPVGTLLEPQVVLTDLALHYGVTTLNERNVRRRIEPAQADPIPAGAEEAYDSDDTDEMHHQNHQQAREARRLPPPRPARRAVVEEPQTPAQLVLFLTLFGMDILRGSGDRF